ncbi:MAG: hypothetical protein ACKO4T_02715 [Planctomycetaceae bacterium]
MTVATRVAATIGAVVAAAACGQAATGGPPGSCAVRVLDEDSGWPVPLVELRTTHRLRFVSDNAGVAAIDAPEVLGRETWFDVIGHGYEVAADGFGFRGVRLTPVAGEELAIRVRRRLPAKRLGRLTGGGLFAESVQAGLTSPQGDADADGGVFGCDSVQVASHDGRLVWAWGDTTVPRYPLGVFDMSGATTRLRPLPSCAPPIRLPFDRFSDEAGRPRGICPMPGKGPTWMSGMTTLPADGGGERLVGSYVKIESELTAYEAGLCAWDDGRKRFDRVRVVWTRSPVEPRPPRLPEGHATAWTDDSGVRWVLFGNPLPTLRCRATFAAWADPAAWEVLEPQHSLPGADGTQVVPHSGAIAWNRHRGRWITVFVQAHGAPAPLGEVWYAEAPSPLGPWGTAVRVATHDRASFYNPFVHTALAADDDGGRILLFEGTYSSLFADRPDPTPRWDCNQVLWRLDLDDPGLDAARVP